MPTYVNRSTNPITTRNTTFLFQTPIRVEFYIDLTKYPDLEKLSDEPIYNPIKESEEVAAGSTYDVSDPYDVSHIIITCISPTPAKIKLNDTTSKEKIVKNEYVIVPRSCVKSIIVTAGTVFIEEWKTENWTI